MSSSRAALKSEREREGGKVEGEESRKINKTTKEEEREKKEKERESTFAHH